MKLFILTVSLALSHAFPSPKIAASKEGNNQVKDVQIATLPNLPNLKTLENSNSKREGLAPRNKSAQIKEIMRAIEKINKLKEGQGRTFGTLASFAVGGLLAALDLVEEVVFESNTANIDEDNGNFVRLRRQKEMTTQFSRMETTTDYQIPTATSDLPTTLSTTTELTTTTTTTTEPPTTTIDFFDNEILASATTQIYERVNLEIEKENGENSTNVRQTRQEEEEEEEDDDDEGGGGGLLGAIISGFLGSLSKADGSVDVDAVVSVIGSLSAMREDGTYDFTGLTDTLSAFFGGDDEGGSDVGGFAGGVLAAVISGVANPPGAKGAGSFAGNLLKQVLPALSGPGPTAEGVTTIKPQVNAGGFLWGLLNSLFGTPANGTNGKPSPPFFTIKMNLIKYLFSALSSILTSSSGAKKGNADW